MFDHFSSVFGTAPCSGTTLNFQALGIVPMDLHELDADISAEEAWAAVKELPTDRAPGPNGYTGAFYKSAWPVIRDNYMAAIQCFTRVTSEG